MLFVIFFLARVVLLPFFTDALAAVFMFNARSCYAYRAKHETFVLVIQSNSTSSRYRSYWLGFFECCVMNVRRLPLMNSVKVLLTMLCFFLVAVYALNVCNQKRATSICWVDKHNFHGTRVRYQRNDALVISDNYRKIFNNAICAWNSVRFGFFLIQF